MKTEFQIILEGKAGRPLTKQESVVESQAEATSSRVFKQDTERWQNYRCNMGRTGQESTSW